MVFADAQAAGKSTVTGRRARSRPASAFRSPTPRREELARYAVAIEQHYGRPMDIEWGRDGVDGKLYILQARPETVKSREDADGACAATA